jgi:hypothetical protein
MQGTIVNTRVVVFVTTVVKRGKGVFAQTIPK